MLRKTVPLLKSPTGAFIAALANANLHLENFLSIRDFTFQTLASFPSDLVGVALVGATPLHLLSQTALPLKSPTGAFIAPLRFANAVPPQTLLMVRT